MVKTWCRLSASKLVWTSKSWPLNPRKNVEQSQATPLLHWRNTIILSRHSQKQTRCYSRWRDTYSRSVILHKKLPQNYIVMKKSNAECQLVSILSNEWFFVIDWMTESLDHWMTVACLCVIGRKVGPAEFDWYPMISPQWWVNFRCTDRILQRLST